MTPERICDKRMIVLGAKGMLGQELMHCLDRPADQDLRGYDLPELDIRDRCAVLEVLAINRPAVVVNAAAYTDVDGCEAHREQAISVNCGGAENVGLACAEFGALMVHFSTDFIFDGTSSRPYQVDNPANPLSIYGRSKWMGEEAVKRSGCRHLVVRTSWLFGPGGRNFVEAILRQAEAGKPLRVVDDQVGSPTLAVDLAEAVVSLLEAGAEGTVHFTNDGSCSWFEFAAEIIRRAGLKSSIERIRSADLDRPAKRPAYSVLDTSQYVSLTGLRPRPWKSALQSYMTARRSLRVGHTD